MIKLSKMLRMGNTLVSFVATLYLPWKRGPRENFATAPSQPAKKHSQAVDHSNHVARVHTPTPRAAVVVAQSHEPRMVLARVFANAPFDASTFKNYARLSLKRSMTSTIASPHAVNVMIPIIRTAPAALKHHAVTFGMPKTAVEKFIIPRDPTFQYDATETIKGKDKLVTNINIKSLVQSKGWAQMETPSADGLKKDVTIELPNTIIYGPFTLREKNYTGVMCNFRGDGNFTATSKNGRWCVQTAKNIGFINR